MAPKKKNVGIKNIRTTNIPNFNQFFVFKYSTQLALAIILNQITKPKINEFKKHIPALKNIHAKNNKTKYGTFKTFFIYFFIFTYFFLFKDDSSYVEIY